MTGLEGIRWGLTLWRPWAAVVVDGPKNIENRTWPPPKWIIGQQIAIHAGKTFDENAEGWIRDVVCDIEERTGVPVPCAPRLDIIEAVGAFVGTARVVGVHAPTSRLDPRVTSPWHMPEQYGWILADRQALPKPIAARGAQKLWPVPEELSRAAPAGGAS